MAKATMGRPDPDQLLRRVQTEEQYQQRGRLKVFLGYASGVGKSFRMLDEGRRRRLRGEDVVVGATQRETTPEIDALLQTLEVIPLKYVNGQPVLDVDAIIRRHPQVCLIDGLAYDNPAGSPNAKRWQDAEQLLKSGISVIASVNVQYIDELQERVAKITGRTDRQVIPRSFVLRAEEIELVDAPADMCLQRSSEGPADLSVSSQEQQLSELRELALLLAAEVVDHQLEGYLEQHGIQQLWGVQERVLVCLTSRADVASIIASGRRNAERFHGELFVVYVDQPGLGAKERTTLETNLARAHEACARVEVLDGEDAVDTVLRFARAHGVTQIFVGHSTHKGWRRRLGGGFVERMIRAADGMDVRVFPY